MLDNYAQFVTHGITLIYSHLEVESTMIRFTEAGLGKLIDMDMQKLDIGFFNLYLSSELHISKNTEVRSLVGQKASVLNAISQSSVYISEDVRFIDNKSISTNGFTMNFKNTREV